MYYSYEKNNFIYDKSYDERIEKIEDLKDKLNIKSNSLSAIMDADVYNSTKIEGNTLTRKEVTYYLEHGVTIRGKSFKDFVQVYNYRNTLDILKTLLLEPKGFVLSEDLISQVHKMITSEELDYKESGFYRNDVVHIRYTDYIPPLDTDVPFFMEELVRNYNQPLELGETQFERICEFKRNFERIHPFFDGNGRTGRVLMNLLFLQNGYGYATVPAEERDIYFKSLDNNTFVNYMSYKMLEAMLLIEKTHNKRKEDFVYDAER